MFNIDKLVFSVKEGYIDIGQVRKSFNTIKVYKFASFKPEINQSNTMTFNNESNVKLMKALLKQNKIRNIKADVVLSIDGIITRLIEIPFMRKSDVEKYIKNNLGEFFTVNIDEYYFDYKIIDIEKDEKKKLNLLLVVIPKIRISDITDFMKKCSIIPDKITIYPDAISNLYIDYKKESIAIFDVNEDKVNVTILDKGKIFLYSSVNLESSLKDDIFSELIDNMGYFLNFYSTRHFGNKIDHLNIIGPLCKDKELSYLVKEHFGIYPINGFGDIKLNVFTSKGIDISIMPDIIGCCFEPKRIYGKNIDFSKANEEKQKEASIKELSMRLGTVLLFITILWSTFYFSYLTYMKSKYNTTGLDQELKNLSMVEKTFSEINNQKLQIDAKVKLINIINNDRFDYINILDKLRRDLPQNMSINTLSMDKNNLNLTFNINMKTLDVAKLVIAINRMGIFEPLDIENVRLDDTINSVSFSLKFNK